MEPIRIFLSYAREDFAVVRKLYDRLKAAGYQPWMDKVDLLKGDHFAKAIPRVIRETDFFIVCLSTRSVAKRSFIQREINLALDLFEERLESDLFIFPVRLDDCAPPERLSKFNWTDLFGEEADDEWNALLRSLQEGVKRLGKPLMPENHETIKRKFSSSLLAFRETIGAERSVASPTHIDTRRKVIESRPSSLARQLATLEQQAPFERSRAVNALSLAGGTGGSTGPLLEAAPLSKRAIAFFIDLELLALFLLPLVSIHVFLGGSFNLSSIYPSMLVAILLIVGYFFVTYSFAGRTIGMAISMLHLARQVTNTEPTSLLDKHILTFTFSQAALRSIGGLLSLLLLPLNLICIFRSDELRSLSDYLSSTQVVRIRK